MSGVSVANNSFVVTGGCGFIGARVVRELLAREAARVVVIDHLRAGDETRLPQDPRVVVQHLTLGDASPATVATVMAETHGVFHLAAEKHKPSQGSPRDLVLANVLGTRDVVEAAKNAGVQKLVFSSSLYAYGRMQGPPMIETELAAPTTLYGVTKLAGEHLILAADRAREVDGVVLRYFFTYGPHQHAGSGYKSVVMVTFERLLRGEAPVIKGDGTQALDYTFVDDLARVTVDAMESEARGAIINVGTGVPVSVRDIVERMQKIAGTAHRPVHEPEDSTANSCRVADISRVSRVLSFKPRVSLDEGLRATWNWMRSRAESERGFS